MNIAAAPTVDWSLVISAVSLAISLVLAVREIVSRPIPLAHVEKVRMFGSNRWNYIGYRMTLVNAGRAPMVVYGIGTAATDKTGTSGFRGSFEWGDEVIENPELPCILKPGESLIHVFPAERYPEEIGPIRISMLKRRWFGRARAKVVAVNLPAKMLPN